MHADKKLEYFAIDSHWLRQSGGLRLDASYYNPRVAHAIDSLRKSGLPLANLGAVTERVFIPNRFARTYVEKEHGIPFLQGSHIVHFQPADLKYVSPTVHQHIDKWVIRENWILVTRSGTVGRIAITPSSWDGWAASEHILRIIPHQNGIVPPGYLYAFLCSPIGQAQLTAQIYGAVVDELTEDQTRAVLVPTPKTKKQIEQVRLINELAMSSVLKRMEAVDFAEGAVSQINVLVPSVERLAAADQRLEATERFQSLAQRLTPGLRSGVQQKRIKNRRSQG